MNIRLDTLLQEFVKNSHTRDDARADVEATAQRTGLPMTDVQAALDGDLRVLYERGAHPLLMMQLAHRLGVNPMAWTARRTTVQSEQAVEPE